MEKYIQIYWTSPNLEEATKVSRLLVEKKLVACANVFPQITSFFLWEGKLESGEEVKVIFKAKKENFENIEKIILAETAYKIPEILCVPIVGGHSPYLKWIDEVTMNT